MVYNTVIAKPIKIVKNLCKIIAVFVYGENNLETHEALGVLAMRECISLSVVSVLTVRYCASSRQHRNIFLHHLLETVAFNLG